MSKNKLRVMMQVLTGHCDLNYFLHKMELVDSPLCPCGLSEETIEHVIGECIMYINSRKKCFNQFVVHPDDFHLLKFKNVLKFMGETERFG